MSEPTRPVHIPVLADRVLEQLQPGPGSVVVDGTLGGGGHTRLFANRIASGGLVIAMDRDPRAVAAAETNLAGLPIKVAHASYRELPEVLEAAGVNSVDAILLDLGLSSDQLADAERGFSYDADGPLDLRFDQSEGTPAWQLIARLSEKQLADIIYQFGEERCSRRIARRIVEQRRRQPIRTARELADLVRRCVPRARNHRIDPATRTFQALRIAVNSELKELAAALERLPDCLVPGGRIAIISFHSLEDRLVKQAFRDDDRLEPLTRKPIRPNAEEIAQNTRSRSARLRVAARVTVGAADAADSGPLRCVVSGGQTGVDRGALDAAQQCGLAHGGWCPRDRRAEDGRIPDKYELRETEAADYPVRTRQNVIDSDATLILYRGRLQGGTELTARLARQLGKPLLDVDMAVPVDVSGVARWIRQGKIAKLNVAGPRESSAPGIQSDSCAVLVQVFQRSS